MRAARCNRNPVGDDTHLRRMSGSPNAGPYHSVYELPGLSDEYTHPEKSRWPTDTSPSYPDSRRTPRA